MNIFIKKIYGKFFRLRSNLLAPKYPKFYVDPKINIDCLGSKYGQKYFSPSMLRPNPILVSGGVGEDISFDIEFISKFEAKGFLFDPTPRAIKHMEKAREFYGSERNQMYSESGEQDIRSYNLKSINANNLNFHTYALLDSPKVVKFYEPLNPTHVSYSVQNIQNQFSENGSHIEVSAIGPKEVCELIKSNQIDVLKLDIEGSEYPFLLSCFKSRIYPHQILIEVDELHFPSFKSRKIAKKIFSLLTSNRYQLIYIDGFNFTYILEKSAWSSQYHEQASKK